MDLPDGPRRSEDFARAGEEAGRALELDEALAEAHEALFIVRYYDEGDKGGAERELKRSLELNPSSATAHTRYAEYYMNLAMLPSAETEQRLALELDPLSVVGNEGLCELLYLKGEYEQSLTYCRRATAIEPDFPRAVYQIALIDIEKGLYEEATELLDRIRDSTKAGCHSTRGYMYARMGRLDKTRRELELELREGPQTGNDFRLAMLYSLLGDEDRAFGHLQSLRGRIPVFLPALKFDPRYASLRSDPRFEPFIKEFAGLL
jgi:tetratricopeptide (TPR) repeat protein